MKYVGILQFLYQFHISSNHKFWLKFLRATESNDTAPVVYILCCYIWCNLCNSVGRHITLAIRPLKSSVARLRKKWTECESAVKLHLLIVWQETFSICQSQRHGTLKYCNIAPVGPPKSICPINRDIHTSHPLHVCTQQQCPGYTTQAHMISG